MLDVAHLTAEEARRKTLEFFHRIGRVKAEGAMLDVRDSLSYRGPSTPFGRWRDLTSLRMTVWFFPQHLSHHARSGLGRIHDLHAFGNDAAQQRRKERIVRAGEHQNVSLIWRRCHRLTEIDARDLLGHGMINPSFLHQRNKKRAGFLVRYEPVLLQGVAIGVAADGGL